MPQQVNLCLPILRKQKSRFAAQTLAQALVVLLLVGGGLSAIWVWNLNRASDSLKVTVASQAIELEGLRAAIEQSKASTGPAQDAMVNEVKQRKTQLLQREKVLASLSQGLVQPGQGHAARLQLVAQTIPGAAWVTHIRADDRLLEVVGYTLEPSALNEWVGKLAGSTLLQGQALSSVKVESVNPESLQPTLPQGLQQAVAKPDVPASAVRQAAMPPALPSLWSFSLVSSLPGPQPVTKVAP